MWMLPQPQDSAEDTFRLCIDTIEDTTLKSRLEAAMEDVKAASKDFDARAKSVDLHHMPRPDIIGIDITKREMTSLYNDRMVGGPGRVVYDRIKAAAVRGLCPLCGVRDATTLDHHLAKAKLIALSVSPLNLVPSCKECNTSKKPPFPATAETNMLHPYYDNVQGERWLYAKVVRSPRLSREPAPVTFEVDAPGHWTPLLTARVKNHFDVLGLSDLYSVKAASRLVGLSHAFSEIFYSDGADGVRHELSRLHRSYQFHEVNSWETALFHAASEDDWFCSGGFGLLPPYAFGL